MDPEYLHGHLRRHGVAEDVCQQVLAIYLAPGNKRKIYNPKRWCRVTAKRLIKGDKRAGRV